MLQERPETGRATLKVYKISPRGFPIEKVMKNDPYGDPEEQRGVTAEVEMERVKRTVYWAGCIMGSADSQYPHPDQSSGQQT